ncbi:putative permease [Beggiatoa alba B18LD]|uniref:Putative permease n=1 Tax=Beggiatoa alba B18LD TaxID=395493 RepID=I3CJN2_9GAMM|nr:AI-2E family transporter [Beggiatoa alba]EIJ43825.1 putative permease [Beggiatoa alba B18LD]
MVQVLSRWFHRYFSDPQAVFLAMLLVGSVTILMTMGGILAPLLASIVIAYLLEGLVRNLQQWRIPRIPAVIIVYSCFLAFLVFVLVILLPLLSNQLTQLFQDLPNKLTRWQELLMTLPERYPGFISSEQVDSLLNSIRVGLRSVGQIALSYSIASLGVIIMLMVYSVLVPFLVFFLLKDKDIIIAWVLSFLPQNRHAASQLWKEMDAQIGNYVRGKVYEIFIVGIATYIPFAILEMNYASLLSVLVGLSVIVPYIGAVVVTIPVVVVGYFQWGLNSEFIWAMSAYTVIQFIDGNIIVPLLFSEAVNLHPVAIIVAVLVFGGLWGFWGVFFAIPLATLVKALLIAWPRMPDREDKRHTDSLY